MPRAQDPQDSDRLDGQEDDIMRTGRHRSTPYGWLTAVLVGVFGLLSGALAVPAYAVDGVPTKDAEVVIKQDSLEGEKNVPFNLTDFGPGDTAKVAVVVRNDADRTAQVTYRGGKFGDHALAPHILMTITHGGVVLASGPANSSKLDGATFQVDSGVSTRLGVELAMPVAKGNVAQGKTMGVTFTFAVEDAPAKVDTGVVPGSPESVDDHGTVPPGSPESVDDHGTVQPRSQPGRSQSQPAAAPTKGVLPPTGESLNLFHLLVWSALGAMAATLVAGAAASRRGREQPASAAYDVADNATPDVAGEIEHDLR